jgi:hypothetical protein
MGSQNRFDFCLCHRDATGGIPIPEKRLLPCNRPDVKPPCGGTGVKGLVPASEAASNEVSVLPILVQFGPRLVSGPARI